MDQGAKQARQGQEGGGRRVTFFFFSSYLVPCSPPSPSPSPQQYVFSYTVEKVGEPLRTVYQSVAMGNNGR